MFDFKFVEDNIFRNNFIVIDDIIYINNIRINSIYEKGTFSCVSYKTPHSICFGIFVYAFIFYLKPYR